MLYSVFGGGSVVVDSLFLLHPLSMGFCVYTSFCPSRFALILMGEQGAGHFNCFAGVF